MSRIDEIRERLNKITPILNQDPEYQREIEYYGDYITFWPIIISHTNENVIEQDCLDFLTNVVSDMQFLLGEKE